MTGFRTHGETGWAGCVTYYLANPALKKGELERAQALCEVALGLCQEAGFGTGMAMTLGRLGTLAFTRGNLNEADQYSREALALRLERDDRYGVPVQLLDLAHVAGARGEAERAVWLIATATAIRSVTGAEIDEINRAEYDRLIGGLRETLGDERFEQRWVAGQAQSPTQAMAAAREFISRRADG